MCLAFDESHGILLLRFSLRSYVCFPFFRLASPTFSSSIVPNGNVGWSTACSYEVWLDLSDRGSFFSSLFFFSHFQSSRSPAYTVHAVWSSSYSPLSFPHLTRIYTHTQIRTYTHSQTRAHTHITIFHLVQLVFFFSPPKITIDCPQGWHKYYVTRAAWEQQCVRNVSANSYTERVFRGHR